MKTTHTTTEREVRSFATGSNLQVRAASNGSKKLSGYAVRFNEVTDLGDFKEVCSPGMFSRTLNESPDVLLLRDHRQELLLARTTAGTLALAVDSNGLRFDAVLQNTSTANDAHTDIQANLLTGCSFGFITRNDSWTQDEQGNIIRTLLDVDLLEISTTSFPAYQSTNVDARSVRSKLGKRDNEEGSEEQREDEDGYTCNPEDMDSEGRCPLNPDYDGDGDEEENDNKRSDALRVRRLFALRLK